ncbi:MAG: CHAT domain-containing tetratricopeptide repeat protein [Candidatus Competibacteraceae bacterium]
MELQQIINGSLSRSLSLEQLQDWVETNRAKYRKPPLMETLQSKQSRNDIDRLIDEYSDWEIRIHELNQRLSELLKLVYDPAQSNRRLLIAEVVFALSRLYEEPLPQAQCAFALGYTRWRAKEYYDAASVLFEAAESYRSAGKEPLMEVTALSYRCDCLRQHKQYDETIKCAEDLIDRARRYGFRGHEASALRDLGMAHSELGRVTEALESLHIALKLRRSLSDVEVSEQSVTSLSAFLDALGIAARKFGYLDEAIRLFLENTEIHRQEGDWHFEARAWSEVGYVYLFSGESDKAIEFLRKAVQIEEINGPTPDSQRWKMQIAMLSKGVMQACDPSEENDGGSFHPNDLNLQIEDESAYLLADQALEFATQGNYDNAMALATSVLRWAIGQRDIHCQIVCRNTLGICHDERGNLQEAISEFQKGIQLADGTSGDMSASLSLRYNLAKVYLKQGNNQNCADVLQSGIAFSQMAVALADSFAFRQQVVSGALPLYELYALLLSHSDVPANHEHLLAITEVVRARNMGTWAQTQAEFDGVAVPKGAANQIEEQLRQLRAVEVELDLRHLTGTLTLSEAETLQHQSDILQKQIEETSAQHGVKIRSVKARKSLKPFEEMEDAIAAVLSPGTAVLSLFSVPEGICSSVFYLDNDGVKSTGSIIGWDRTERIQTLSRWTGETAFLRSRSTRPRSHDEYGKPTHSEHVGDSSEQTLNGFLRVVQERLFQEIVPMIQRVRPSRLAIIPHRELALVPYWNFVDYCDSINALTLIPSLNLLRICVNRVRGLNGKTITVPDVTGTLPQTHYELESVQTTRKTMVGTVASVNQLIEVGSVANLLHIAAHGIFNSRNPYYSGYLMDSSEQDTGLFAQYVEIVESDGKISFQFFNTPHEGCNRLMTVADCMARLSLRECRLAVLSACECGLADSYGGGELTGLPTSLLVAGAKSVIAALWPVDDAATALLMARFYHYWAGGSGEYSSPAQSLELARRDLKKMGRMQILDLLGWDTCIPDGDQPFAHPIYSDAFHCFGDW